MDRPILVPFSEIVEENGKTIRENNLERQHAIPLGTLVEVKFDKWCGNGACKKVHARLFVVGYNRDCDGTPLYSLAETPFEEWEERLQRRNDLEASILKSAWYGLESGFSEESLTPVEVTDELIRGEGALSWEEE
jgi:hypothetical protein